MKNYEQKWQRDEQKDQKHQNIILSINEQTPDRRAKAKAKTGPSRPEHNADHKNERTPNNSAKAKKQRAGPSPNQNIHTLPKLPPFPTGETASGSQDKPKRNNPESEHEPKGKPCRPRNNQGPPPVRKNNKKPNPKHDTDVNNNTDFKERSESHNNKKPIK